MRIALSEPEIIQTVVHKRVNIVFEFAAEGKTKNEVSIKESISILFSENSKTNEKELLQIGYNEPTFYNDEGEVDWVEECYEMLSQITDEIERRKNVIIDNVTFNDLDNLFWNQMKVMELI